MVEEISKSCSQCKETKPLSEFTLDSSKPDGHCGRCKDCRYYSEKTKKCVDCGIEKNTREDFYPGQACCKLCSLKRKKQQRIPKPKPKPIETPPPPPDQVFCKGRCQRYKNIDEFHKHHNNTCKECVQYGKFEKFLKPHEFIQNVFKRSQDRAKKSNINFEIELEQLEYLYFQKQRGFCALSGKPMTHCISRSIENYERFPDNVSVDRIDSKLGYTFDNIQLVRWCVNSAKNDMEQNDFIQMCREVYEYNSNPKENYWVP